MPATSLSRRSFLRGAASAGAAVGVPTIVPSSVFGARAPSNRIAIGCIGVGRMGTGDMKAFLRFGEVQVVAVCDVDANRAAAARGTVQRHYRQKKRPAACDACGDFRELIARGDIDAVSIVTPDHWHTIPALWAARAGKDIFLQKPLTRTVREGRILAEAVRRYGRILQVGSQQRSDARFRFACELVRNGRIGRLHTVRVGFGADPPCGVQPVMPVPRGLDYDMWLGPAPWSAYTEKRVHPRTGYGRPGWLRITDYSGGMITGWGAHHMDIAHWGMGAGHSGPVEIEGRAKFPANGLWDVHGRFLIRYTYANGVKVICADTGTNKQGVLFEGTDGWVHVRRGAVAADPGSLLREKFGPGDLHLYESRDHKGNFLECIRTRQQPVAPVEDGHRSCTACLLGEIAMRLGRKLRWDPARERFVGDDEADRMLDIPSRPPWHT